jgi:hypothetical protein
VASLVGIALGLVLIALIPSIMGVQMLRRRSAAPPEYRSPLRVAAIGHFLRGAMYLLVPFGVVLWAAGVPGGLVAVGAGIAMYPVRWLIEYRALRPWRDDPTFRDLAYSRPLYRDPELTSDIEVRPIDRELRRAFRHRRIGFGAAALVAVFTLTVALARDWPQPSEGPGAFGLIMSGLMAVGLAGAGIALLRPEPEIRDARLEKRPVHIEQFGKSCVILASAFLIQASVFGLMVAFIVDARWPIVLFLGMGVAAGAFYWYRIGVALRGLATARETANRLAPR